jgi:hypothetical protein
MGRLQETKFSLSRNIKREKAGEKQRKRKRIKVINNTKVCPSWLVLNFLFADYYHYYFY